MTDEHFSATPNCVSRRKIANLLIEPADYFREVLVLYLRRPREVVDTSVLDGRFRYSDLKEAAPRVSLWVLYVVGQVPMIGKVAVGSCVRQSQREKVQRRILPGWSVEV